MTPSTIKLRITRSNENTVTNKMTTTDTFILANSFVVHGYDNKITKIKSITFLSIVFGSMDSKIATIPRRHTIG